MICLFLAVLGTLVATHRLSLAVLSRGCFPRAPHGTGFSSCSSQALERRLSSRGAGTEAREIFLEQGSNPCPLHWQEDS